MNFFSLFYQPHFKRPVGHQDAYYAGPGLYVVVWWHWSLEIYLPLALDFLFRPSDKAQQAALHNPRTQP